MQVLVRWASEQTPLNLPQQHSLSESRRIRDGAAIEEEDEAERLDEGNARALSMYILSTVDASNNAYQLSRTRLSNSSSETAISSFEPIWI